MIPQPTDLSILNSLTEADRLEARDLARANVTRRAGPKPDRRQFDDHELRAYPRYIVVTVTLIVLVLVLAFFSISAMRLYSIGSHTFAQRIGNPTAQLVAGIAIVIGSEAGALGFLLAAGVLAADHAQERRTLYGLAFASTLLALLGNMQFALGGDWRGMITADPFAIFEACFPPVVVLGAGLVFKRLWLADIASRHANDTAYRLALAEWQALTADPESSPAWRQSYANALRQRLIEANTRGRGKTERGIVLTSLTRADWRALVSRELRADDWYQDTDSAPETASAAPQHDLGGALAVPFQVTPNGRNGNGNGVH